MVHMQMFSIIRFMTWIWSTFRGVGMRSGKEIKRDCLKAGNGIVKYYL